jgi:hypothetical protein
MAARVIGWASRAVGAGVVVAALAFWAEVSFRLARALVHALTDLLIH